MGLNDVDAVLVGVWLALAVPDGDGVAEAEGDEEEDGETVGVGDIVGEYDGLPDADGEDDGLPDADGEDDGLPDADGEYDGLPDADGEGLGDGDGGTAIRDSLPNTGIGLWCPTLGMSPTDRPSPRAPSLFVPQHMALPLAVRIQVLV